MKKQMLLTYLKAKMIDAYTKAYRYSLLPKDAEQCRAWTAYAVGLDQGIREIEGMSLAGFHAWIRGIEQEAQTQNSSIAAVLDLE